MNRKIFQQGTFFVGTNYWASHAGLNMWSQWDAEIVENDFRLLSNHRIKTLRIFPLWSDFQPIRMHKGAMGRPVEVRMGEDALLYQKYGEAGISETMMNRLDVVCNLAQKYQIQLIIGLITGWMSGRLFIPEMLENRNILTDPVAIKWELKYVRGIVKHLRPHPAVVAWDLGNECNCMGVVESSEQAYVWASAIANAIRSEDHERPIVSGMHSLSPTGHWRMQDQSEFLDVLCTHPYPLFTPYCDTDPMNQMKSSLHAAAETSYYSDLGKKPCFVEELGVLGPMFISDDYAADYIRTVLFQLLSTDGKGMIWWCAFEQSHLERTPYDWNAIERELGLFYSDKTPKPVLIEIESFDQWVHQLPFDGLPRRIQDAVCILTHGQDNWAVAYGTFILAKQAHMDVRFVWTEQEIPDAQVYILPSLQGDHAISKRAYLQLIDRVKNGATLVISLDGAILSPFSEVAGVHVLTRRHQHQKTSARIGNHTVVLERDFILSIAKDTADVLAFSDDGDVVCCRNEFGKGTVYTVFFPIEKTISTIAGFINGKEAANTSAIYSMMNLRSSNRIADIDCPEITLTEHVLDDTERYLVTINCEPYEQETTLTLLDGWKVEKVFDYFESASLKNGKLSIRPNNGVILKIFKE